MRTGDTIVAVGSAPGVSPRSLIRLSGPRTPEVLASLLTVCPPARRAVRARVRLDSGRELPVLVVRFEGPRSYTGEASGEVQCPGNPVLVRRLVDQMLTACEGVREAEPGEFTARAYLAGRLSLDQAEGVAWTIAAATDEQFAAASDLLAGRAGARCDQWAEEVATLLALVEAGIDFTDQEDVVPIRPADLVSRLSGLREQIDLHLGSAQGREAETDRPLVVLVGEPNAGKSTLFNALLGRERAVASDRRGTTRDALIEDLPLDAEAPGHAPVRLADLPGLDADPRTPADAAAVGQAREVIRRADLLVYCDPAGRFPPVVGGDELPASGPVVRVRTKADLPGLLTGGEAADAAGGPASVAVSAVDGRRLSVLRRAIADACIGSRAASAGALMPRHARAMREASEAIGQAMRMVDASSEGPLDEPELVADALRTALDRLGEVTGRIAPDEVLGRVFSTFCVGK